MKTLICRLSALAALAALLSVPAMAADRAVFQLSEPVAVGGVELPAGEYTFEVMDRGVVLVYDTAKSKLLASALTMKASLPLADLETSGTLSHDWAVRTLSLGEWRYTFPAGERPVAASASKVAVAASGVALAR